MPERASRTGAAVVAPELVDLVARALGPGVLLPYAAPVRIITLGSPATHWIRQGYAERSTVRPAAGPVGPDAAGRLVAVLADATGHVAVAAPDDGAPIPPSDAARLIVATALLERAADPARVRDGMLAALRAGDVLVYVAPIRRFERTDEDEGPPSDDRLHRQWTLPELHAFLNDGGIDVAFGGLLPGSDWAAFVVIGE